MLLAAVLTALPIAAAEQTTPNYDNYYVEGAKVRWDAFDRLVGDTHAQEDVILFRDINGSPVGTFGNGYLSVKDHVPTFTDAFGNDGQTDYTLDLTVAMQETKLNNKLFLGVLSGFNVNTNCNINETRDYPVDASYGIVSYTYRTLKLSDGTSEGISTDGYLNKVRFIGNPLGRVYSFAVTSDYTVENGGTGTVTLSLLRDSANVQTRKLAYPVQAGDNTVLNTSVFSMGNTDDQTRSVNYDYYALRYYERVLTEEELAQNHFVDLAKWFGISLDAYDEYEKTTREALHLALREETFDTLTRSTLQSAVDSFGALQSAVKVNDIISFEGFSAALTGAPGLRSTYTVDRTALKALEKDGYAVTVGALVAAEGGRDIAAVGKDTQYRTIVREVYKNGEFVNPVLESDEDSFRFALTTRYDTANSSKYYEESLLYRAYVTLEKDGTSTTLYLDAEGDTFGNAVTVKDVSLLFAFLGNTYSTPITKVLGENLIAVARATSESYAPLFKTRANAELLSKGISDYLFYSYLVCAEILTNTGEANGTYTYANASPYYKLFDSKNQARNLAAYDTVKLLLQCENACSIVNYAADMTTTLYNELLDQQELYVRADDVMAAIAASATASGLDTDEASLLTAFLTSYIGAHEKALADAVRDVGVVYTNVQTVKGTVTAPTEALNALHASLFKQKDVTAFGSDTPLSSYVILANEENAASALILSSLLADKYGVYVPYYTDFPETAEYAHTISILDASDATALALLGDNDYLLTQDGTNALFCGRTASDAQVAAITFARALQNGAVTLTETVCKDAPDLFNTDLPTYLKSLNIPAVEDGGVLERFRLVLDELPSELSVVQPLSSAPTIRFPR